MDSAWARRPGRGWAMGNGSFRVELVTTAAGGASPRDASRLTFGSDLVMLKEAARG